MQQKLTPQIIEAAIRGYEAQQTELQREIDSLRSMLDGRPTSSAATPSDSGQGKRKRFSLASRRKMAAAQKARWAKLKGSEPTEAVSAKPKRKLSASAKKRIGAAVRKRWALKKAAAKKAA